MAGRDAQFAITVITAAALVAACGGTPDRNQRPARDRDAPADRSVESTTRAAAGATAAGASATDSPAVTPPDRTGAPRVLFLGTSLTAGYGLDDPATQAYPAVIQQLADSSGVKAEIVNAGLSGETSAGALRRIDWLLRQQPNVVVIETGANDGLRGLNPESTATNIVAIVKRIRTAHATTPVLLVQMEAPTNLGPSYTREFHAIFGRVAREEHVTLLPFLLDRVAGIPRLNQSDGIHPTSVGARIAAHNLWPALERVLREMPARR